MLSSSILVKPVMLQSWQDVCHNSVKRLLCRTMPFDFFLLLLVCATLIVPTFNVLYKLPSWGKSWDKNILNMQQASYYIASYIFFASILHD